VSPLVNGVPGFFSPRQGSLFNLNGALPIHEVGFYDTSGLATTLTNLVDFDYLAEGKVRFSVCAVHIPTGELAIFDNRKERIEPHHIMASGALPPGFPPVIIDGEAYWDGGIYSNTPLEIVLDDARRHDTLIFMVDLWDPTERTPGTINEAISRHKDITYASRSKENLSAHRKMQDMRRVVRRLGKLLTPAQKKDPNVQRLLAMGNDASVDIIRIIMKALPYDTHSKDIDFSRPTIQARWKAGHADMDRVCQRKTWIQPRQDHVGLVVRELEQL
jgi:NTE family protein